MGSSDMVEFGKDKSMSQTYKELCWDAEDMYGRDPYNGTISTTEGYCDKTSDYEKMIKEFGPKNGPSKFIDKWTDRTSKHTPCVGTLVKKNVRKGINQYMFVGWVSE